MSSTSNSSASIVNTDEADNIYADTITFNNWTVINGDDGLSHKTNSTNILVMNSTFIDGIGFAIILKGAWDLTVLRTLVNRPVLIGRAEG